MTRMPLVLTFIVLTFLCWGSYGPVLHVGQDEMGKSLWRPFIFVGVAYFLVAVCVPLLLRRFSEEPGSWRVTGVVWSTVAGVVGALGSLGILLAFSQGGRPVFVMPLVFGCAPVVNTIFTMLTGKTASQIRWPFLLGILLVALGAAGVLRFKPAPVGAKSKQAVRFHVTGELPEIEDAKQQGKWLVARGDNVEAITRKVLPILLMKEDVNILEIRAGAPASLWAIVYVAMTALCWGTYGPLLHKGQAAMGGSRLRPFICVGVAYFFVAIVAPGLLLLQWPEPGHFSVSGSFWSLAAGTLGAVGALGVIMAFNNGGRPVFVMPLVFGGAPVVNTCISMLQSRLAAGSVGPLQQAFILSLALVIAGATIVLVFAPRPSPPRKQDTPDKETAAPESTPEVASS